MALITSFLADYVNKILIFVLQLKARILLVMIKPNDQNNITE